MMKDVNNPVYQFSRDYDDLYDLVKAGAEILGQSSSLLYRVAVMIKWYDQVLHVGNTVLHDDKELFVATCDNLNLEYIPPTRAT